MQDVICVPSANNWADEAPRQRAHSLTEGKRGARLESVIDARGYGTAKSGSCNASRGISAIKSRTGTFPASHTFSASAARVGATRGNPAVDANATARDFVPESGGVAHHGIARL